MRYLAYLTVRLLDFHVVYTLIHNVQQELRDHYRHGSRMNSRTSILTVTIGKECSR